jgi:hypothetical protein
VLFKEKSMSDGHAQPSWQAEQQRLDRPVFDHTGGSQPANTEQAAWSAKQVARMPHRTGVPLGCGGDNVED